ncbi:MAG: hypothetical protein M1814_006380 [Vezdaea aestivalis]|nr:MAG: hypothetical protein M1814_006380 [Vezdaea aestivalis]
MPPRPPRLPHPQTRPYSSLPRLAQPKTLATFLPRLPLTSQPYPPRPSGPSPWRPFVILGLLTGSQALHILNLQEQRRTYSKVAKRRVRKLTAVVEALMRGEEVDVEEVLKEEEEGGLGWEEIVGVLERENERVRSGRGVEGEEEGKNEEDEGTVMDQVGGKSKVRRFY